MRWTVNGDADGVPTMLWQWRLRENDGVCRACDGYGGDGVVCCGFCRDRCGQWL